MVVKREIIITFFILSSALCAQLYAQRYTLSVIKTAEPVNTITWNKNGTYFGYAERNNIVLRSTNGYTIVQHIPTYKSDINFLKFAENTAGLDMDQLATLHESGLLDFRILPDIDPTISLETENSEPTVMTYSNNGNYFAVGNKNGTVLLYQQNYLTQTVNSQQIGNLGVPITSLCFSRDNKYLLIGAADNSVTTIEVASRKIVNGYAYNAKNKVPILMTADSKSIIMTTGDSTIGFFDLEFNRYNYYTTYRDILSMHISADDRFLIILTDDNVFSYYDLQTHELKKYIPAFNETKILTYAFDVNCQKLAVSHEDGSLYVLDVNSVILDMDQTRGDYTITEQSENLTEFDFSSKESKASPTPAKEEPKAETPKPETPKKETPKAETPKTPTTPKTEPKTEPATKETPKAEEKKTTEKKESKKTKKEEDPKKVEAEVTLKEPTKKIKEKIAKQLKTDEEDIKTLFKDGHGVVATVGIGSVGTGKIVKESDPSETETTKKNVIKAPYIFNFNFTAGYYNYDLIQPFYFGGLLSASLAIPDSNFPFNYSSPDGALQNPYLVGYNICAPIGFTLYPWKNSLEIHAEISIGANAYNLWNGGLFSNALIGKLYPSFYAGFKVGAAWDFIDLSICGNYNPIMGYSMGLSVGALINIGGTRTLGSLVKKNE